LQAAVQPHLGGQGLVQLGAGQQEVVDRGQHRRDRQADQHQALPVHAALQAEKIDQRHRGLAAHQRAQGNVQRLVTQPQNGDQRAGGRACCQADDVRAGQRVARQALEDGAGGGQRRARAQGHQGARQAQVHQHQPAHVFTAAGQRGREAAPGQVKAAQAQAQQSDGQAGGQQCRQHGAGATVREFGPDAGA
jgi:hypothetical protein